MKKLLLFVVALFVVNTGFSQTGYEFEDITRLPTTSVKSQSASGTCWAFSAVSFIESEMIRKGTKLKNTPDISEMYIVRKCYEEKAAKYIRMHGNLNFGGGGAFYDVFWAYAEYGFMPEDAYTGLNYGKDTHNHREMDKVLKAYVEALKDEKGLTTAWLNGFNGILDAYLGELKSTFTYKGKEYSPRTFADEIVDINPDDYISITSYTHHPFYSTFSIEIPDNWQWSLSYNVPMNEMVTIADNAINEGYTIAWGADISEAYFTYRGGVAVVPDLEMEDLSNTDRSHWDAVDQAKYHLDKPGDEKTITQQMRQDAFDNYQTTDDHGMHIVGLAKDQNGTEYYIVKNSWNTSNLYDGYFYLSKAFFLYKTMNYIVHKDAIPADIRAKMGL